MINLIEKTLYDLILYKGGDENPVLYLNESEDAYEFTNGVKLEDEKLKWVLTVEVPKSQLKQKGKKLFVQPPYENTEEKVFHHDSSAKNERREYNRLSKIIKKFGEPSRS